MSRRAPRRQLHGMETIGSEDTIGGTVSRVDDCLVRIDADPHPIYSVSYAVTASMAC
jgi:hypothetical protein